MSNLKVTVKRKTTETTFEQLEVGDTFKLKSEKGMNIFYLKTERNYRSAVDNAVMFNCEQDKCSVENVGIFKDAVCTLVDTEIIFNNKED